MIQHKMHDLFEGDFDILLHQVNCRGTMGSGVARQVREKCPGVYDAYKVVCAKRRDFGEPLLGYTQLFETTLNNRHIVVANAFAQDDYGYDKKLYTNYTAFMRCLRRVRDYVLFEQNMYHRIAIPYLIGCDRGGGDWEGIVYPMICELLAHCNVTIYQLPEMRK